MKKVGIIGTGRIGSHLAESLLKIQSIKEIHLANRNKDRLEGRLISLKLRCHLLGSTTKIMILDKENINDLDLIVICAKDNYDPRKLLLQNELPNSLPQNLRYVGLLKDLPLFESICNRIKHFKGIVAVVSNPVEINTYFISKWLPNATVLGLGASVDSARISFVIKNELDYWIDKDACIVSGEHGFDLIPISKIWNQDKQLAKMKKHEIKDYIDKAQNVGFEIVNKLGFTLQDCVPVFAEDIKWLLEERVGKPVRSFAIPSVFSCYSRPINFELQNKIIELDIFSIEEEKGIKIIENRIANFVNILENNIDI